MLSLRHVFSRTLLAGAGALALATAGTFIASDAAASVSVSMPFEALVRDADAVVLVTAGDPRTVWEDGRIYTYTQVKIDQGVAGDVAAGADGWVRTMGGVVGQVGQIVDGEAILIRDKPSLLFLRKFDNTGVYEVSARAQGQYPVVVDEKTKLKKIIRSTAVGMLVPPKGRFAEALLSPPSASGVEPKDGTMAKQIESKPIRLANVVLHDRPIDDVAREIATEWKRQHSATPTK